jgi:NAD(P)-dependent dehydrogenase (short-subunit alcohol dehydrogenase family)
MSFTLQDKVAIVTGSGSGIGKATATVLAERGASVVIADINPTAAKTVAADLQERGLSALAVTVDVSDEDQIVGMIEAAVSEFGGLDLLHNNAALLGPEVISRDLAIVDLDAELFAQVLRVNVTGYLLSAKHAIPHMLERGGGVIINTSSAAGVLAELIRPMYGTSKAAIIGLTRNIATQYGRQGIRSVAIAPGIILTPAVAATVPEEMQSALLRHSLVPRPGRPEDIAYTVAFLMSDEAAFITGITIPVDGGLTVHFPSYAEELDAQSWTTPGFLVSAVDASPITAGTPNIHETLQAKEM